MGAVLARRLQAVWVLPTILGGLVIALVVAVLLHAGVIGDKAAAAVPTSMPENLTIESELGVKFSHLAVVGGGGLVELTYTVLDPEKATTFQSDTTHPPSLNVAGDDGKKLTQTALMKQGHNLRPGQEYFILYSNTGGLLRRGSVAEIRSKAGTLAGVPVE